MPTEATGYDCGYVGYDSSLKLRQFSEMNVVTLYSWLHFKMLRLDE